MAKRYITPNVDGSVSVITVVGPDSDRNLANMLFELSRTTDMATHFDPAVHTLDVIAAGIDGHRPLALLGECEHTDLPSRYFRNAWEWSG